MGYLFSFRSRESLIEDVQRRNNVLETSVRNNEMWVVHKNDEGEKFLSVLLIKQSEGLFGYKQIEESHGPYYYNVPKKFLKMVPCTNAGWRAEVRKHQKEKSLKTLRMKKIRNMLKKGDTIYLRESCKPNELKFVAYAGKQKKILAETEAGFFNVAPRFIDADKTIFELRKNID